MTTYKIGDQVYVRTTRSMHKGEVTKVTPSGQFTVQIKRGDRGLRFSQYGREIGRGYHGAWIQNDNSTQTAEQAYAAFQKQDKLDRAASAIRTVGNQLTMREVSSDPVAVRLLIIQLQDEVDKLPTK